MGSSLRRDLKELEERPHFKGFYKCLRDGRLWLNPDSNDYVILEKDGKTKKLFLSKRTSKGAREYLRVTIYDSGKEQNSYLYHVINAETFLIKPDIPDRKLEVNHKNSDRWDGRVDNLEYVTSQENIRHAVEAGSFNTLSGFIIDLTTGDKYFFFSYSRLITDWGFDRSSAESYLKTDMSVPLLFKWGIEFVGGKKCTLTNEDVGKFRRTPKSPIKILNKSTGEVSWAVSMKDCAKKIDCSPRLIHKLFFGKNSFRLKQWEISFINNYEDFLKYHEYKSTIGKVGGVPKPIFFIHDKTGEKLSFKTITEASKYFKITRGNLSFLRKRGSKFLGYSII